MKYARPRLGSLVSVVFLLIITIATTSGSVFADSNETSVGSAFSPHQGAITLGESHTCALLSTGSMKCWGANFASQLGDGTTTDRSLPTDVVVSLGGNPLNGITAITAGGSHTCALMNIGSVKCWGDNGFGQLGDGTTTGRTVPTDVVVSLGGSPLSGVVAISAGASHTCALLSTGSMKCWGYNRYGSIGDGTNGFGNNLLVPTNVVVSLGGSPLNGITAITAGAYHTCALLSTSAAKCWGYNGDGEIGDGTTSGRSLPTDVVVSLGGSPLNGITAITAGAYHTCALLSTSAAKCWGDNYAGGIGDGSTTGRTVPTDVVVSLGGSPLNGITAITGGNSYSCARMAVGQAKCWGYNGDGELGDGTITDSIVPTDVVVSLGGSPLNGITAITAGTEHMCGLLSNGTMKCWGSNETGQLGDGTSGQGIRSAVPADVLVSLGGGALPNVGPASTTTTTLATTTTIALTTTVAPTTTIATATSAAPTTSISVTTIATTVSNGVLPSTGSSSSIPFLLGSSFVVAGALIIARRVLVR